jgi:RNA polymerase sigma factor (sigma-70 family)
MSRRTVSASLRTVVGLLDVQALRSATDEALLRRFVHANDEAAFRVIAERHGPMVLGICRRALRSTHDADDAFQATFLVFSRRAASIRKSASLGSWFHGVALRVAMNLRREQARRQRREQGVRMATAENAADTMTWAEIKTGLDEELQRLPERQRSVLVLCYLEGRTRDEAAQQLGLTLSALHGRLERGRRLLAARLTKRGLTLSAAFLSVAICQDSMVATVRAAALFAGRQSIETIVAPSVLALTNETLKGMTMKTTKCAIASLACSAMLVVCVGFTTAQTPGEEKNKALDARDARLPLKPIVAPKPPDANENLKNTLLALDKQMWEAGAKGDWRERQKFLADDMVSISILGKYGKADAAASDQRLRTTDWSIRDPEVVRVSGDVAMLSYIYDCKIVDLDGNVLETRKDYRAVYTWANRNGGWLIVFVFDDHGRQIKAGAGSADFFWLNSVEYQIPLINKNSNGGVTGAYQLPNLFETPIVPKVAPTEIDLNLLRTKVELAKLAVKEKQLRLDDAIEKKTDRNQIELLKIEVDRAHLLVKEAELNLAAATARNSTPPSNTPGGK